MLIAAVCPGFTVLLVIRFCLGLGEGLQYPLMSTYVKRWFPLKERGKANASWAVGVSLGPALAMPLFAWITHAFGWRACFFTCVVVGMIPLYLIWCHTTDTPETNRKVNESELRHIKEGLASETQTESKAAYRENILLIIRNYRFWMLVIYWGGMCSVFFGLLTWLPTYLKVARGFSWAQMGLLSSIPFVLAVGSKSLAGWLSDRLGRSAPFCVIAMLGVGLGTYLAAIVSSNIASALLLAFGMGSLGLGTPTAFTVLQRIVPAKAISVGAGALNGIGIGVSAASPVLVGAFIKFTGTYAGGLYFMVAMAMVAASGALVLAIRKY
jgi:sugar phosphate permease